jgi:hypothetical protein
MDIIELFSKRIGTFRCNLLLLFLIKGPLDLGRQRYKLENTVHEVRKKCKIRKL